MEKKKNPNADLESKRGLFFGIGMVISLIAVLMAFTGTKEVTETYIPESGTVIDVPWEVIPPTWEKKENTPKELPKFLVFNTIDIVTDDTPLDEIDVMVPELGEPVISRPPVDAEKDVDTSIVLIPGVMPEFPGGMDRLNFFLSKNIHYPQKAVEMGLSGRVYINFVVDKDGAISNATVTRGIDPLLDEEALRVINSMPKWKPGLQNNKPVRVSFNMFVTFKLN
jgi:periplasmic protein TonB